MTEPAFDHRALPVPEGLDGLRLDAGLARLFGLSRTQAADVAESGYAQLDGVGASKSERLRAGAWLEVALPVRGVWQPPTEVRLADGVLIRHDDDDVIVIDKPEGVASHPSPGYQGPTVTGGLRAAGYRLSTSGAAERQGVVHRLDVGTSGLLVLARSERAYTHLKAQFRDRTVDKRYRALVQGRPDPLKGTVDAPIDRHPSHPYRFAVVAGGRDSVTHYDTVESMRAASLLEIKLETGRTHQIRVHMSALRHPCVGDLTYGADPTLAQRLGLTRQWLHATSLTFEHPGTRRPMAFVSEPPEDLRTALDALRTQS